VKLLLDARADPTIVDNDGNIPLSGVWDVESMRLLIEAAPKTVYHRDADGSTLLMILCAGYRDIMMIEQLFTISSECNVPIDVNGQDNDGDTALRYADFEKVDLLDFLLRQGADVTSADSDGVTVLMDAFDDHEDCTGKLYMCTSLNMDELRQELDRLTQRYLRRVLSHLHRKANFATMLWGPCTCTVRRRHGRKKPAAKRRRM
jgi:ankyrin repeat protein